MQAIELPEEFQIKTKKSPESMFGHILIFSNLKEGRALKYRNNAKNCCGIHITSSFDANTNLHVSLFREGPNILHMVLFNFLNFKVLKRVQVHIHKNSINTRFILRICSAGKKIIFYHESQATIEIRSLLSLKIITTVNILELCQSVYPADMFNDARASLDLEYVPHLSSSALLLGTKIVLAPDLKLNQAPTVIFDSKELDQYRKLIYNRDKRTLLAVGGSTILLIEFDNYGVSHLRLLSSDKISKASRFLCWEPEEDVVIFSQKVSFIEENYYILSYRTPNLTLIASLQNIPTYGQLYHQATQTLMFIEGKARNKWVGSLSLKNINISVKDCDEPAVLEGECLVYIPDLEPQTDLFTICHYRNTLFVKPLPTSYNYFNR